MTMSTNQTMVLDGGKTKAMDLPGALQWVELMLWYLFWAVWCLFWVARQLAQIF